MIADILVFLKNRLNAHFLSQLATIDSPGEDNVIFLDGDQKSDAISFKLGAVSILLFNIEHDVTLRPPDIFTRVAEDGTKRKINPEIIVSLYVLLVAKYKTYEQSLQAVSIILQYFQVNPIFDPQNSPELHQNINRLVLELNTLTVTQQNEIWGMLRSSYLPSISYKVKAAAFIDEGEKRATDVSEIILEQEQL
jgi:hypothetical protein